MPLPFPGALTPAQLAAAARAQANAEYAGPRQQIADERRRADEQNAQHGQAIQGFGTALADILKGIAPQIQQTYGQAADRQTVIAKGYSDGMRAALGQSADQTNSFLQKQGAPEGQMIDPGKAEAAANVLYGTTGAIPAGQLNSGGAAFSAAASFLPATALGRAQQDFTSNVFAGREQDQKFADQLRELEAKYPGTLNDVISHLTSNQAAMAQQHAQLDAAASSKALAIFQATGKVTPEVSRLLGLPVGTKTVSEKRAEASQAAAAARAKQSQANSDRSYALQLARLAKADQPKANASLSKALGYVVDSSGLPITQNGKKVILPKTGGAKKGLTVAQVSRQRALALGAARRFHMGWTGKDNKKEPPGTWQEYMTWAESKGIDPKYVIEQGRKVWSRQEIRQGLRGGTGLKPEAPDG